MYYEEYLPIHLYHSPNLGNLGINLPDYDNGES